MIVCGTSWQEDWAESDGVQSSGSTKLEPRNNNLPAEQVRRAKGISLNSNKQTMLRLDGAQTHRCGTSSLLTGSVRFSLESLLESLHESHSINLMLLSQGIPLTEREIR